MEKLSSSFSWKSLTTRIFLTFFFLIILTAGVFAAPNGIGTIYEKWMQKIFVSLPEGNNASTTPLSNPTVKRAHTIADENGTEVARGAVSNTGEKTLLIGTDFASDDTVRVYGEDAGIQITAKSGNPEISLGETDGSHGSVYLDSNSGTLRVWTGKKEGGVLNGQNALEISGNQINFPEKLQANGTNVITAFTCPADSGVLIGFDAEGNPLCSNNTNKTSWVSVPKEGKYTCSVECGGGTVDFDVSCKSGNNYSVLEDDQVCLDLGLEKPAETRECNTFSCKEKVDGNWTNWKDSGSCGLFTGIQHQTRACKNPFPYQGGLDCSQIDNGNTDRDISCLVHGLCGDANNTESYDAPRLNLCAAGKHSEVIFNDITESWEWICEGFEEGNDSPLCSVSKPSIIPEELKGEN